MSRTRHLRLDQIEKTIPGQRNTTKLTNLGSFYRNSPVLVKADGNRWQGTISDVGGNARRRNQHAQRDEKILGRRIERKRLKAMLDKEVSTSLGSRD